MSFAARTALALVLIASVTAPSLAARKAAHKPAAKAPPAAEQPTLLGVSKAWKAFQANSGEGKVCYALSSPTETSPKGGARDPMYVIISVWPGRNVRDELQVVAGYTYKEGEPVWAQVGNRKTEFFARNDGAAGSAWVKDLGEEADLVRAMRGANTLTVTGVSKKGTKTTDTYSLSGIGTALQRAHQACGK
jgi:hypothetical protein